MTNSRVRDIYRWLLPLTGVAALVACESQSAEEQRAGALTPSVTTDSMGAHPTGVRRIPVRARPELRENSGVAMSLSQPELIFTINDSGHEPIVFALDTAGADRGAWRLRGATNVDWEAISSGPCGSRHAGTSPDSTTRCLYIGDVGDNDAKRTTLTLYRVAESRAGVAGSTAALSADALVFRFEDGPRDVEAMYVAPDATVYLISKRPLRTVLGRLRPARIYGIPAAAWAKGAAVARFVDTLPIVPGSAPLRTITDASLSPDARYLAVRTYSQVYLFATDSQSGRVRGSVPPAVCNVAGLEERQGEGISWYGTTKMLLLSSEGRAEPLRVIECPIPRVR